MRSKRILGLTAGLVLFGLVGCETDEGQVIETEREIVTEPTTETVEVERITQDTMLVEREYEMEVDTVQVENGVQMRGTQPMNGY